MRVYSDFFATLHDELAPVGNLGRGTHYSVLRAVIWPGGTPVFHDFAVIWDEDHDTRVIWILEQMYLRGLLAQALFVGESQAWLSVLLAADMDDAAAASYVSELEYICERDIPSDSFTSEVSVFLDPDSDAAPLIQTIAPHRAEDADAYLSGIRALWQLGSKPAESGARSRAAFFPVAR